MQIFALLSEEAANQLAAAPLMVLIINLFSFSNFKSNYLGGGSDEMGRNLNKLGFCCAKCGKAATTDKFCILLHNLVFEGNPQIQPIMFHYRPNLFMLIGKLSVKQAPKAHANTPLLSLLTWINLYTIRRIHNESEHVGDSSGREKPEHGLFPIGTEQLCIEDLLHQ